MHHALGAIHHHRHAVGVGDADDLLHGNDGAQHIGHMGDRHHLRARREGALEFVHAEVALLIDADPFQHRALALPQEMPGHDVGVMLHDGEDDLVPLADGLTQRGRHKVQGLGRRPREDDLVGGGGVEEGAGLLARALESLGRGVGEIVQAAMDIRVFVLVGIDHAVDDRARLLRRGGVVEIDKLLAIGFEREDRKIRPHLHHVIGSAVRHDALRASQSLRPAPSRSRMLSSPTNSSASRAKPSMIIPSASTRGKPRAIR